MDGALSLAVLRSEMEFFAGDKTALAIYAAVKVALDATGPFETRVSRSQIAFYRAHPFAAVWRPGRYLRGGTAPVVLSIYLRHRRKSPRWKEVAEPHPGRFTHHAELSSAADLDEEVKQALAEAWREAE